VHAITRLGRVVTLLGLLAGVIPVSASAAGLTGPSASGPRQNAGNPIGTQLNSKGQQAPALPGSRAGQVEIRPVAGGSDQQGRREL
jgi:hypothetical protein